MRILFLAALWLLPSTSAAQPITPADLRAHIEVLASDAFEGRKPGTEGENRAIQYIASQLQAAGLEPAAEGAKWYQPVELVERASHGHRLTWSASGQPLEFNPENIVFIGNNPVETLTQAPVWFVAHGVVDRAKGIDQLAGADLAGAVALILYDGPDVPDFPGYAERVKTLVAAGAAAVIGIVGDDTPWPSVVDGYARGQDRLGVDKVAKIQGAMPVAAAARLIERSGGSLDALLNGDFGPAFRAVGLRPTLSAEVTTRVHRYPSHNVIARLRGRGETGESVLYLAHWDHFGICRPEGAADRICNGAVDNASGLAAMIEVAERLAKGARPKRDTVFLATTAEEIGLLGAQYFVERPPVELKSIVAAINIDTVAISGPGEPVAIIGRGTGIDPLIEASARELGRAVDPDDEAAAFVRRQDGWAFTRAGVPAVMVGGSFANMATLGAFLSSDYHKPEDDLDRPLVLGGAAEDANLLVALGRKLADPDLYAPGR